MKGLLKIALGITLLMQLPLFAQIDQHSKTKIPTMSASKYTHNWEKADSLNKAGLPGQALEVVNEIAKNTLAEDNMPLYLKAVLYQVMLKSQFESDYLIHFITETEESLSSRQEPAKQIMHSILAGLYWKYYEENQHLIYDRTRLPEGSEDNMRLWDASTFIRTIVAHYTASLANSNLLRHTDLKNYDVILETGENSKQFRPTLYDFLANRAIEFYNSQQAAVTIPIKPFQLNTPEYFGDAQTFVNLKLNSNDTLSFIYEGTRIYQQLLAWRLSRPDTLAFIDADLHRLNFVKQHSPLPGSDSLYLHALIRLEKAYSTHPATADIMFAIASVYAGNLAVGTYPVLLDDKTQNGIRNLVKAHAWCEKAINSFPQSLGAQNCQILKQQIEATSIDFQLPEAALPDKAFPLFLEFKNTDTVWIKILKADPDEPVSTPAGLNSPENLATLNLLKPLIKWSVDLPKMIDFESHSVDLIMPELERGFYTLIIADNEQFNTSGNNLAIQQFWVSNLSLISYRESDGSGSFYILDRNTGLGIKEVKVVTFTRDYDYRQRTNVRRNQETYRTSANGSFNIKAPADNRGRNLSFDLQKGDDRYILNNSFGLYASRNSNMRPQTKTWFFTDRSLYRPGQIIYYKGLMVYAEDQKYTPDINKETTVTLYDVNGTKIASKKFTTNEFGTFNGEFTLPQSMSGGTVRIADQYGNTYVNVEEYKRPQFEVKLEKPEGSYKLNQKIEVKGQVDSYSGVPFEGATVSYRVVRNVWFPYPMRYYRRPFNRPEAEIANGITTTDTDGIFNIEFVANPDSPGSQNPYAVFNFSIYASVTDINGETHSSETTLNVSNRALILKLKMDEVVSTTDIPDLEIEATNLSGLPVSTGVIVEIVRLKPDNTLLYERKTAVPDTSLYTREEWYSKLPHEPYRNEMADDTLIQSIIFKETINTQTDSIIPAARLKRLGPGKYRIRLKAVDAFDELVELEKTFVLADQTSSRLPEETFSFFHVSQQKALPGETIILTLGSSVKNANILYRVDYADGNISGNWVKLSGKQQNIQIPILESYRGNIAISALMVTGNHIYTHQALIEVPYYDTKLNFEFETFRNELLPGVSEEWRIKILDPEGKPAAAEFLATMYDASLDAISPHQWNFNLHKPVYHASGYDVSKSFGTVSGIYVYDSRTDISSVKVRTYDRLNWFGFYPIYYGGDMIFSRQSKRMSIAGRAEPEASNEEQQMIVNDQIAETPYEPAPQKTAPEEVSIRKNLNETAFFFPEITAHSDGNYQIKFTVPEALTRWNFMGFAHTTELNYGSFVKQVVTRKNLMVTPNLPRFFRQNDTIHLTARISNLTGIPIQGTATLELFDAINMLPLDAAYNHSKPVAGFEVDANGTAMVQWKVVVPENAQVVMVRVSARAGNHTDGEEHIVPVLSNRMLVTETLPLPINGKETKNFSFERLSKLPGQSNTLRHQGLTLEFTSNPAWLAVQSLPVLMEPRYDNADAVFRAYYANALARHIAHSNPVIQRVFDVWKTSEPNAFLSNLEKNQELKSVILSETPWVLQAASESAQKQRLALLFDENTMESGLNSALRKLQQRQTVNGGWPWFQGYRESRYITQQVVTGFGKLHYLKVIDLKKDAQLRQMVNQAVNFLTNEMLDDYKRNEQARKLKEDPTRISPIQIYYLFSLSYLDDVAEVPEKALQAIDYYSGMARNQWQEMGLGTQAMIGLWAGRSGDGKTAQAIIRSLRDKALYNEEMGLYWRDNVAGYSWYNAPVQTQALLIELFEEIADDGKAADQMRTWLIKQKQVQAWPENTATAEAIYALLIRGTSWLQTSPGVIIKLGDKIIDPSNLPDARAEAGTGYIKMHWNGPEINSQMGKVVVSKTTDGPAWGALYWQYFEDLDKITSHQSPLSVERQLFVKRNSDAGPVLDPVEENETFKVGDQISVRIVLSTDRDLDFVHLKDMRAAGFEPAIQLSGYNWKGGLGYYQTTRDVSGDFFFDHLPKGTWVLEYPVVVTLKGNYSAGIATVQCMYAPEFSAHSEGIRVKVE
jgi:hypothetical protein